MKQNPPLLNLSNAPSINNGHKGTAGSFGRGISSHYCANNFSGLRALVVDDSEDNRTLVTIFLKLVGIEVTLARDGVEAVQITSKQSFDVILMDIQMPRLDGRSATSELRKLGYAKPIIALTAHAMDSDRELSLRAGCDEYLVKPIDRALLYRTIASVTGRLPSA